MEAMLPFDTAATVAATAVEEEEEEEAWDEEEEEAVADLDKQVAGARAWTATLTEKKAAALAKKGSLLTPKNFAAEGEK
jgi:hypothetical protein